MNINQKLAEMRVDCSRGAPMGRRTIAENTTAAVYLAQVEFVDGDYDAGGAYWGSGNCPLFCAMSESGDFLEFVRASDWADAKSKLGMLYPQLQYLTSQSEANFEQFLSAYITAALWVSPGEDDCEFLDQNYGRSDIAEETLAEFREDCQKFLERAGDMIGGRYADAGHDFWLTRNGHGAGFLDGDWTPYGRDLAAIAEEFSEINLYVSDGKVY